MEKDEIGTLELKDEVGMSDSDSSIEILESHNDVLPHSFFVDTSTDCDKISDVENTRNQQNASLFTLSSVLTHFGTPESSEERKSIRRKSTQTCFNCDSSEHNVRNCPHAPDSKRISRNRNSFKNNQLGNRASARIHEDTFREEIVPGKISSLLREALGVGSNELPEWIYRMRKLGFENGYPPAYRKRAAELNIFKLHMDDSGQKDPTKNGSFTILSEKIIKYPGFNYDDGKFEDQKRERYKIPPWDSFVESQKICLNNLRKQKLRNDIGSYSPQLKKQKISPEYSDKEKVLVLKSDMMIVNAKRMPLEEGEIEEEECSETTITTECVTIYKSHKAMETNDMTPQSSSNRAKNNNYGDGKNDNEELRPVYGTPIPMEKHISTAKLDHQVLKPKLENFAEGIQPFQHQAPVERPRGFISRLQNIVKSVRKNNN